MGRNGNWKFNELEIQKDNTASLVCSSSNSSSRLHCLIIENLILVPISAAIGNCACDRTMTIDNGLQVDKKREINEVDKVSLSKSFFSSLSLSQLFLSFYFSFASTPANNIHLNQQPFGLSWKTNDCSIYLWQMVPTEREMSEEKKKKKKNQFPTWKIVFAMKSFFFLLPNWWKFIRLAFVFINWHSICFSFPSYFFSHRPIPTAYMMGSEVNSRVEFSNKTHSLLFNVRNILTSSNEANQK